eukprot:gene7443-5241_t
MSRRGAPRLSVATSSGISIIPLDEESSGDRREGASSWHSRRPCRSPDPVDQDQHQSIPITSAAAAVSMAEAALRYPDTVMNQTWEEEQEEEEEDMEQMEEDDEEAVDISHSTAAAGGKAFWEEDRATRLGNPQYYASSRQKKRPGPTTPSRTSLSHPPNTEEGGEGAATLDEETLSAQPRRRGGSRAGATAAPAGPGVGISDLEAHYHLLQQHYRSAVTAAVAHPRRVYPTPREALKAKTSALLEGGAASAAARPSSVSRVTSSSRFGAGGDHAAGEGRQTARSTSTAATNSCSSRPSAPAPRRFPLEWENVPVGDFPAVGATGMWGSPIDARTLLQHAKREWMNVVAREAAEYDEHEQAEEEEQVVEEEPLATSKGNNSPQQLQTGERSSNDASSLLRTGSSGAQAATRHSVGGLMVTPASTAKQKHYRGAVDNSFGSQLQLDESNEIKEREDEREEREDVPSVSQQPQDAPSQASIESPTGGALATCCEEEDGVPQDPEDSSLLLSFMDMCLEQQLPEDLIATHVSCMMNMMKDTVSLHAALQQLYEQRKIDALQLKRFGHGIAMAAENLEAVTRPSRLNSSTQHPLEIRSLRGRRGSGGTLKRFQPPQAAQDGRRGSHHPRNASTSSSHPHQRQNRPSRLESTGSEAREGGGRESAGTASSQAKRPSTAPSRNSWASSAYAYTGSGTGEVHPPPHQTSSSRVSATQGPKPMESSSSTLLGWRERVGLPLHPPSASSPQLNAPLLRESWRDEFTATTGLSSHLTATTVGPGWCRRHSPSHTTGAQAILSPNGAGGVFRADEMRPFSVQLRSSPSYAPYVKDRGTSLDRADDGMLVAHRDDMEQEPPSVQLERVVAWYQQRRAALVQENASLTRQHPRAIGQPRGRALTHPQSPSPRYDQQQQATTSTTRTQVHLHTATTTAASTSRKHVSLWNSDETSQQLLGHGGSGGGGGSLLWTSAAAPATGKPLPLHIPTTPTTAAPDEGWRSRAQGTSGVAPSAAAAVQVTSPPLQAFLEASLRKVREAERVLAMARQQQQRGGRGGDGAASFTIEKRDQHHHDDETEEETEEENVGQQVEDTISGSAQEADADDTSAVVTEVEDEDEEDEGVEDEDRNA